MINIQPITFTSNGYHDITQNLLESIVRNNIEIKLDLYALDNESFEYFNDDNSSKSDYHICKNNLVYILSKSFYKDILLPQFNNRIIKIKNTKYAIEL